MTEEQSQAALEALDTLADWANKCLDFYPKGKTVPDIAALKTRVLEVIQSPPVPVIEGLEESIQHLIRVRDLYSREAERWRMEEEYSICEMFKTQSDWIRTCVKAAHAYAELQKGEQNGHDQS